MALDVATGSITITTGAVGTTFTVSGLSFQPQAILFFWSGRASAGQGEGDHMFGAGFATGTASRRAYFSQSDHAAASAAADTVWRNDACVGTLTVAGAIGGLADLNAINADGFELVVDDQFPAALIVGWIAYGGSDIEGVGIVDFQAPTGTGNQSYNVGLALNTGEDDKAVIFLGGPYDAANSIVTYSMWMLGVAAGDTPANAVLASASSDGAATMLTNRYSLAGECCATIFDDLVSTRAALTAWTATGFTLNWAETDSAQRFSALAILGGRWAVGDSLTSTGTTNQDEVVGIVPTGLLIGSHGTTASTSNATQAGDQRIVGAAAGPTSRRVAAAYDRDAQANAEIGVAFLEDAMYVHQDDSATIAIDGQMDLVDFDVVGDGFTWVMDDADPAQAFFFYLASGSAPGSGTTDADASSAGEATAIAAGAATGTGAGDAVGASTATMTGMATVEAGYLAQGESTAIASGMEIHEAVASSDGVSTANATGESTASADISADGVSTFIGVGASTAFADMFAEAVGTAEAEGASVADGEGSGYAAGESTAEAEGSSTASADYSATGEGTAAAQSDTEEAEIPETRPARIDGQGGAWGRNRLEKKKRKRALENEDRELIALIQRLAPEIMRHRRTLH